MRPADRATQLAAAFFKACWDGELPAVKGCLRERPELATLRRADGTTCAHVACARHNAALLRLLLEHGADRNALHSSGATPLILAVQEGDPECVAVLLEQPGPPPLALDAVTRKGQTALFVAARRGRADLLRMLLERGSDPERTQTDATPLFIAAKRGHADCLHLLIKYGANVNAICQKGVSPLEAAIVACHPACVILLIEAGARLIEAADPPPWVARKSPRLSGDFSVEEINLLSASSSDEGAKVLSARAAAASPSPTQSPSPSPSPPPPPQPEVAEDMLAFVAQAAQLELAFAKLQVKGGDASRLKGKPERALKDLEAAHGSFVKDTQVKLAKGLKLQLVWRTAFMTLQRCFDEYAEKNAAPSFAADTATGSE